MCTIRKVTEVEYLIRFGACRMPLSDYYLSEKGSAVTILGLLDGRGEGAGVLLYEIRNEVTEILYLGAAVPGRGTASALLGYLAAEERQKGRKLLLRVNESHPCCGALKAIAEKQGFRLQDRVEIFRSRGEDYKRWLAYMERHGNRILAFLEGQGFEAVPFASADPGLLARLLDRKDPEYDRAMDPARIVRGQAAYFCREMSWLSVQNGRLAAYCLVCRHNENDYIFEMLSARKEYQGTGVIFQPFARSVRSVGESGCGTIEFAMFERNRRAIALSGRVMKHLIRSRSLQYNYILIEEEEQIMTIQQTEAEGSILLKLEGRLDTTTAPQLEKELSPAVESAEEVTLDFEDLEYISSAGLRVLLMGQKTANRRRIQMMIKNVNETIMEVFEMTGFADILTID